jgi:hypothetical protein
VFGPAGGANFGRPVSFHATLFSKSLSRIATLRGETRTMRSRNSRRIVSRLQAIMVAASATVTNRLRDNTRS